MAMKTRNWSVSGHNCPECGSKMIINHTGHECSHLRCEYRDRDDDHFLRRVLGEFYIDHEYEAFVQEWLNYYQSDGSLECRKRLRSIMPVNDPVAYAKYAQAKKEALRKHNEITQEAME